MSDIPFEQWHPDAKRQCGFWWDLSPIACGQCERCRKEQRHHPVVQLPATPQEPEQAQTLNDVFDVFETWARRKGATDTSSVSLGFWAFNEFHAIIGQPLRDWLLSRRASTPSPEGQTTWKDKIAEYRALIVDMQTGTQVRSLRASELREVMAIQGTLRVLLRELDQRFPAPPTPEGTEQ